MAISMLKIRRPLGRLIFNMGIAIPGKTVFLIEMAPCLFPGTTWMQEIIWSLTHGPGAIEKREGPLEELFPFLDQNAFGIVGIELVKNLPDPRFIKTHLQSKFFARVLDNVASCPKFVVVIRNPKDALVSYYHFHRSWPAQFKYPGTWDQFFEQYKRQDLAYGDYMDHVLSWWTYKDHPRVMFVQYEDLLTKPHKTIKEIGWFLGAQRNDAEIDTIVQETSFNAMKSRPLSVIFNKPERFGPDLDFYRKGHANTWKEELFNGEQSEYVDGRWNSLCQQHGMPFLYDA